MNPLVEQFVVEADETVIGLVENAIDLIEPPTDARAACREWIWEFVFNLADLVQENRPPPSQVRTNMKRFSASLRKTQRLAQTLSREEASIIFRRGQPTSAPPFNRQDFNSAVDELILWTDILIRGIVVPKGSPRLDIVVYEAAKYARILLDQWSAKAISLTPEGPFCALTQTLANAAGRPDEIDVKRACEAVTEWARDLTPSRSKDKRQN